MNILNLHFNVFPRGPIRRPTKLMSGCSSWGIITLSCTRIIGGLKIIFYKIQKIIHTIILNINK